MIVACLADITQHNNETLIKHAIRLKKMFGLNPLVATSFPFLTVATDKISQIYMMQRPSLAHIYTSVVTAFFRDPPFGRHQIFDCWSLPLVIARHFVITYIKVAAELAQYVGSSAECF